MSTFVVSGAVHDLFASLVTVDLFVLFVPVFAVFGLLVVSEEGLGSSFAGAPFWLRAIIHSVVTAGTVAVGVVIRSTLL
jgi:hypothetical protein